MENTKDVIREHSILAYFLLTFFISWGGIIVLGAPHGMPTTHEQFQKLWPVVFLPYLLGPILSSFILTGIVDGRAGFRELRSRLLNWRVGARWYAVALLTGPLLSMATLLALSLTSSEFLPGILVSDHKASLVLLGLAATT